MNRALRVSQSPLADGPRVATFRRMTVTAIKAHLDAAPFNPFQLVTASGKSYRVKHPDFLTFSPAGRTCNVYGDDGEYFTTLDVFTVSEVVPAKRGATRRRD